MNKEVYRDHATWTEEKEGSLMFDDGKKMHIADGKVIIRVSQDFFEPTFSLSLQFRDFMIHVNLTDTEILRVRDDV